MDLYIRQKVFSWSDTFWVLDEFENEVYYAKAEYLTFMHHIHLYKGDLHIGILDQRFGLLPRFDIELYGESVGTIHKEFTFFVQRYYLNCNDWQIRGNVFGMNYEVLDGNDNLIMSVDKAWLSWGDVYRIHIEKEENADLCVMIVLAIDAVNCSNN